MKLIIAGSRTFTDFHFMENRLQRVPWPSEVVSGCAHGADRLGERWAQLYNIPVKRFPADWGLYGKSAGYRRNQEMAAYADVLAAFWDGKSRGTKHMIDIMLAAGKPAYVFTPSPPG